MRSLRVSGLLREPPTRSFPTFEKAGYIDRRKSGRRNVYSVDPNLPLRHHTKKDIIVSELLEALTSRDLHLIMGPLDGADSA